MNKKILGASAAAAVLAAMPLLGTFAVEAGTQTDTVEITVPDACSMTASGVTAGNIYKAQITNGQKNDNIAGSTFSIVCNDSKGWELTAVGAGEGKTVDVLDSSTGNDDHDIATNAELTGSAWAFKAKGENTANIQSTYENWSVIPTTAQIIAQGNSATDSAKVVVTYGVSISDTQPAGTYTGKVKYTLSHPIDADGD